MYLKDQLVGDEKEKSMEPYIIVSNYKVKLCKNFHDEDEKCGDGDKCEDIHWEEYKD